MDRAGTQADIRRRPRGALQVRPRSTQEGHPAGHHARQLHQRARRLPGGQDARVRGRAVPQGGRRDRTARQARRGGHQRGGGRVGLRRGLGQRER